MSDLFHDDSPTPEKCPSAICTQPFRKDDFSSISSCLIESNELTLHGPTTFTGDSKCDKPFPLRLSCLNNSRITGEPKPNPFKRHSPLDFDSPPLCLPSEQHDSSDANNGILGLDDTAAFSQTTRVINHVKFMDNSLSTPEALDFVSAPDPLFTNLLDIASNLTRTPEEISIVLVNARSLLPKIHFLKALCTVASPSFLCITETWLCETVKDVILDIPGYTLHRADRHGAKGGGCAIYARRELRTLDIEVIVSSNHIDSVWITSNVINPPTLIGCIYSPPSIKSSVDTLTNIFSYISSTPSPAKIIVGDFNLPKLHFHDVPSETSYPMLVSQLFNDGWSQLVREPTRGANILDLVFVNGIRSKRLEICPPLPGCDHNVICCSFITSLTELKPCFLSHSLTPDICSAFADLIRSNDWTSFFLSKGTQESCDILYDTLLRYLHSIAPLRNANVIERNKPRRLRQLCKKIHKLKSQFLRSRDFHLLLRTQRLEQQLSEGTRMLEIDCEKRVLSKGSRPQDLCHLFKSRFPSSKTVPSCLTLESGETIRNPIQLAECFNKFFSSCYLNQVTEITYDDLLSEQSNANDRCTDDGLPELLQSIDVKLSDVNTQLKRLKASSVPGTDGLPPTILQNGGPDVPLLIMNLFTSSLGSGVVPIQWKHTIVVPHYKSGRRDSVNSYRGIHHTSHLLRALERVIKTTLVEHIIKFNLVDDRQYGFLSKRSITTCQAHFLQRIADIHNTGKAAILVYLDIQKAFDQVPHNLLLARLRVAGVSGSLLKWFSSYFSGRTQSTLVGGYKSPVLSITSGVMQGSVLGPVLFLLYINSIFASICHGEAFLFADDVKIIYALDKNSITEGLQHINRDLADLLDWSASSHLQFSTEKCFYMQFRCEVPENSILLYNNPLRLQKDTKDLGLRYSCTFNFSAQGAYLVARARQLSYLILRLFHLRSARMALFKTRVRPILELHVESYSLWNKSWRLAIESVQRRFSKALFPHSKHLTYQERCHILCIEPLWLRRMKLNLLLLHRLVYRNAHIASYIYPLKFTEATPYNLRNTTHTFPIPHSYSIFHTKSYFILYTRLWNKLPEGIRCIDNHYVFRCSLIRYLTVDEVNKLLKIHLPLNRLFEEGPMNF